MATSKIKLRYVGARFYWRRYFGIWFFAALAFATWPDKHAIKGENAGGVRLAHFVDAVPIFLVFLAAAIGCIILSLLLAPRLKKAARKGHAKWHPLLWVPLAAWIAAFAVGIVVLIAFWNPVVFIVLAAAFGGLVGLLSWKGHKG